MIAQAHRKLPAARGMTKVVLEVLYPTMRRRTREAKENNESRKVWCILPTAAGMAHFDSRKRHATFLASRKRHGVSKCAMKT